MVMSAGEVMRTAGQLVESVRQAEPPLTKTEILPFADKFFRLRGIEDSDQMAVMIAVIGVADEIKSIREL